MKTLTVICNIWGDEWKARLTRNVESSSGFTCRVFGGRPLCAPDACMRCIDFERVSMLAWKEFWE